MPETATRPPTSLDDVLLYLISVVLAPMFLIAGGDINYARLAAQRTVDAYRTQNDPDLIAVAQIIACGLAALGSLSLSMTEDLSPSMILRLRGNAVALNRSAELNRRAIGKLGRGKPRGPYSPQTTDLDEAEVITALAATQQYAADINAHFATAQSHPAAAPASNKHAPDIHTPDIHAPDIHAPDIHQAQSNPATPTEKPPASPQPVATTTLSQPAGRPPAAASAPPPTSTRPVTPPSGPNVREWQRQAMWAAAAANIAAEYTTKLDHRPPEEHGSSELRAAALNSAATELLSGNGPPRLNPSNIAKPVRP